MRILIFLLGFVWFVWGALNYGTLFVAWVLFAFGLHNFFSKKK